MRVTVHLPRARADNSAFTPQELIEFGQVVEKAGFSGVWLGDVVGAANIELRNYGKPFPPLPDPLLWLLLAAAGTTKLEVGTAVYQIPVRARVDVAQCFLTMHALTRGRFLAGVGTGSSRADFEAAGLDFDKRFTMLRENLGVIQGLLRGETVGDAKLTGWSDTTGAPPILIGSWVSELWIKRAARDYDGWIVSGGGSGGFNNTWRDLKEKVKMFRDNGGKRAVLMGGPFDFTVPRQRMTDDMPFTFQCSGDEAVERIGRAEEAGFTDVGVVTHYLSIEEVLMIADTLKLKPAS